MPTRILRDWTDSSRVNQLGWPAECLFVRLIMAADDYGRYTANPKLLRARCFPLRDLREADLVRWLGECSAAGLIRLYEVEGKPLLEILNFQQRTRAKASKFSSPEELPALQFDGHVPDMCPPNSETETKTETEAKRSARGARDPAEPMAWPTELDTPACHAAWAEWEAYRRQRKLPKLLPKSVALQLAKAVAWGPQGLCAAIQDSIANGWQGLFAPKAGGRNNRPNPKPQRDYGDL